MAETTRRGGAPPRAKADVTAIVLAAGHGKRLQPITRWLPKPLVSVGGQPILLTNLQNLAAEGFPRAMVVSGRHTAAIPDFLESVEIPGLEVMCGLQKEQRGTGDAFLTGLNLAPPSGYYLLMAGDTVYSREDLSALWERFAVGDVDGCLLLKELPPQKLVGSSLVVLGEDGTVSALLAKPSVPEMRAHGSRLADASLQILRREVGDYLGKVPLSRTSELEMSAALHAWIEHGARIAGVVREAPVHVTGLEDFLIHNAPFARPLVAAAEFEAAIGDAPGDDRDVSGYIHMLRQEDLPFVHRRLKGLSGQPMKANRQARVLAVMSEIFRHQARAAEHERTREEDAALAALGPADIIAAHEPLVLRNQAPPGTYHALAVAYGRLANGVVAEAVLRDALSRTEASTGGAQVAPTFQEGIRVRTPARLAFSSSQGSDISYIIEERSAVILNAAIKVRGLLPGTVTIERTEKPEIELVSVDLGATAVLREWDDVFGQIDRSDPLILLKAGVRFSGVLKPGGAPSLGSWLGWCGGGFRVTMNCLIPRGSGLGCSGILAAGLVRGLREFAGLPTEQAELLVRSYCCERHYGRSGYQDILGGMVGGVKLIEADGSTGLFSPKVGPLELSPERMAGLRENLLIFYTGAPHLDWPYLLTIPAKYFTGSSDYLYAYENGKQLTHAMAEALCSGDWETLGHLIGEYWDDREYFEEGVTPPNVREYREDLRRWCHGTALCGSGRGGFMMAVLKPSARDAVLDYLSRRGIPSEAVLDYEVSAGGLEVECLS